MKVEYSAIEWRDVVGFEGRYKVSEFGEIYSCLTSRTMKTPLKNGYPFLLLLDTEGKRHNSYVHRVVAEAYLEADPEKTCVNHIDGIKTNNHYTNLEYCTLPENVEHALTTGLMSVRGELNGHAILTEEKVIVIRERLSNGERVGHLAKEYGVCYAAISKVKARTSWGWLS